MSAETAVKVSSSLSDSEIDGLFREHYQLVFRTAYSITSSAEDAEDIVQSIFVRVIRQAGRFSTLVIDHINKSRDK